MNNNIIVVVETRVAAGYHEPFKIFNIPPAWLFMLLEHECTLQIKQVTIIQNEMIQ